MHHKNTPVQPSIKQGKSFFSKILHPKQSSYK